MVSNASHSAASATTKLPVLTSTPAASKASDTGADYLPTDSKTAEQVAKKPTNVPNDSDPNASSPNHSGAHPSSPTSSDSAMCDKVIVTISSVVVAASIALPLLAHCLASCSNANKDDDDQSDSHRLSVIQQILDWIKQSQGQASNDDSNDRPQSPSHNEPNITSEDLSVHRHSSTQSL